MENESIAASTLSPTLQARQVYAMASVCLLVGLAIGYIFRGAQSPDSAMQSQAIAVNATAPGGPVGSASMPSMEQMKQMAGKQPQIAAGAAQQSAPGGALAGRRMPTLAEMNQIADKHAGPLLEKLKTDPNNTDLLLQVGAIYHSAHRFKEASVYYGKAVQIDPKNVMFRNKLASSQFRNGDVDGAIAQLNHALSYDPNDANSLFNLGTIKLQGKQDSKGALAAWRHLLKSNPQLSSDRRAMVEKLMADVMNSTSDRHGSEGAQSNDGHK